MKKYGLVMEGGGMRGAYTAGCLSWLLANNIEFDNVNAISATAVFVVYFLAKDGPALRKLGIELMSDKRNIGVIPVLTEAQMLGYRNMFKKLLRKKVVLDLEKLRHSKTLLQFGVYRKEDHQLIWVDNQMFDEELKYLWASCVLPVGGRAVKINGQHYIDGGVLSMMPIFHAEELANDRFFCITTKHESYVRTPNGKILNFFLRLFYWRYPKMLGSLDERVDIYNREKSKVQELLETKKALLMRPSKLFNVSRLSASKEDLSALFDLGYQDCEDRREEIFAFFELNNR